jgi:hypothetical protein
MLVLVWAEGPVRAEVVKTFHRLFLLNEALGDEFADVSAELGDRSKGAAAGLSARREPGSREAERHVGVLGVSQDEIAAARVGEQPGEFGVE